MAELLKIRPASAKDLPGLTRVYLDSAEHHTALDPLMYRIPSVEEIHARYLARVAQQNLQLTLVALWEEEVVGLVDAQMLRSMDAMLRATYYCHVAELAVAREHRSQGVGARLLQAAEDWGRDLGAEVVSLDFHIANDRAGKFYRERMGYRVTSKSAVKIVSDQR
jgi:GNAT superfamily N-acetyltransferase